MPIMEAQAPGLAEAGQMQRLDLLPEVSALLLHLLQKRVAERLLDRQARRGANRIGAEGGGVGCRE